MIDPIDQDVEASIKVNDVYLFKNFRPSHNGFKIDSFHIGHLLKYGKNRIRIQLDQANTNYYIQSIHIKRYLVYYSHRLIFFCLFFLKSGNKARLIFY